MKTQPLTADGKFVRPKTQFRNQIMDFSSGRYRLYISKACPWSHRTLIARKLAGLEDVIAVTNVDPYLGEKGWFFEEDGKKIYLRELYEQASSGYAGRVTVPVLWDKEEQKIVNNESREIMRMFMSKDVPELVPEVDRVIDEIYEPINNGVYRAGFATTQKAYNEAVGEVFDALNKWEKVLAHQNFLAGPDFSEADICMFVTLFRFDAVYYSHFKCNCRRIMDYPNLWNYTKAIYQMPRVAETCDLEEVKTHYYSSHQQINPTGIVPKGPLIDFDEPHNR